MYESVIRSLGDWLSMSDDQIVDALFAVDQQYAEPEKWMSLGIASIIGDENMPALLSFMESTNREWLRQDLAFPGLPIGDPVFNAKLMATNNPYCIQIAQYGRRLVSRCYLAKLPEDRQAVLRTLSRMRLDSDKGSMLRDGANRWNAFKQAVDLWDGNPATRPNL